MTMSGTKKLTKYVASSTVITADVANSLFGGLKGSAEELSLSADDPRVIGHKHDGEPYDGHAGKIDLVNHVDGKLLHRNLSDEAVYKNNVSAFLTQDDAIPEYYMSGTEKYYYLDLRDIYTYVDDEITALSEDSIAFKEFDADGDGTNDIIITHSEDYSQSGLDFVFGSSKCDDLSDGTNGDHRFYFNRIKGSFRAGIAQGTEWNKLFVGDYSFATGKNNTSSGDGSFAAGESNTTSGDNSAVFGESNEVSGTGSFVAGKNNKSDGAFNNILGIANTVYNDGGGSSNSKYCFVVGQFNECSSEYCFISGNGNQLFFGSDGSAIFGYSNKVGGKYSFVFGKEAKTQLDGEFVHASGKFDIIGDAQVSQYVVRGSILGPIGTPGNVLTADGISSSANYKLELDSAYHVNVMLIGKLETPSQEAAAYKLEGTVIGPTLTPSGASVILSSATTIISGTPYFTTNPGMVDATITISPTGGYLQISVFDTHHSIPFKDSRWVATVTLTKCKF